MSILYIMDFFILVDNKSHSVFKEKTLNIIKSQSTFIFVHFVLINLKNLFDYVKHFTVQIVI